jgi:hypothetical protein
LLPHRYGRKILTNRFYAVICGLPPKSIVEEKEKFLFS